LINEGVFYGFGGLRQPLFSTFCFIGISGHILADHPVRIAVFRQTT